MSIKLHYIIQMFKYLVEKPFQVDVPAKNQACRQVDNGHGFMV